MFVFQLIKCSELQIDVSKERETGHVHGTKTHATREVINHAFVLFYYIVFTSSLTTSGAFKHKSH